MSPIKSTLVFDINKDGHQDIITVGNHYGVEVETHGMMLDLELCF